MGSLLTMLTRFVGAASKAIPAGGALHQSFAAMFRTARSLAGGLLSVAGIIGGVFADGLKSVLGLFTDNISKAIGFELSLKGLMDQAEEARKFFSELADEMNFYSSSTGSTANAMNILLDATGKSKAGMQTLRGAMESMVNAGVDDDKTLRDMTATLGDFEVKTGVAASQWGMLTGKFQQMFNEKKGITKDIKDLQVALIGTGLKGAALEQTMQGLTESAEKLAFATRGDTLEIKKLAQEYGKTVTVFKAFGVNAQTTTNFLNGMLDPENVEKNMLLMNKLGISYGEFNDMLNTGKGQEQFFNKIINNIGDVAKEANMIEDAATRYKYLKDTLQLPPEIANKLMKVAPHRMQGELRRIKREMEEAEKKEKWRKDLKAREEKYEESLRFLRMQMVAPLVDLIERNRTSIAAFSKAMVPVMQGISRMVSRFLTPFTAWMDGFTIQIEKITQMGEEDYSKAIKDAITDMIDALAIAFKMLYYSPEFQSGLKVLKKIFEDLFDGMMNAIAKKYPKMASMLGIGTTSEDVINKKTEGLKGKKDSFSEEEKKRRISIGVTGQLDEANKVKDNIRKKFENSGIDTKEINQEIINLGNQFYEGLEGKENMEKIRKKLIEQGNSERAVDDIIDQLIEENMVEDEKAMKIRQQEETQMYLKRVEAAQKNIDFIEKKYAEIKPGNPLYKNYLSAKKAAEKDYQLITGSAPKINASNEKDNNQGSKENQGNTSNPNNITVTIDDSKVKDLKEELNNKNTTISEINAKLLKKEEEIKLLKEKKGPTFEDLYNNLFGVEEDSLINVLKDIRTATENNLDIVESTTKRSRGNVVKNTDLVAIGNATSSGSGNFNYGGTGLGSASSVKSIQAKQAIYLKSIAETNYDTMKFIQYIAKNLIFTPKGLLTNNTPPTNPFKLTSLYGEDMGAASYLGNFTVKQ